MAKGVLKTLPGLVTKLTSISRVIVTYPVNIHSWNNRLTREIAKTWPEAEKDFRLQKGDPEGLLGQARFNNLSMNSQNAYVVAMYCIDGNMTEENPVTIKYERLMQGMRVVAGECTGSRKYQIHMQKFGADFSGACWEFVKILIQEMWLDKGIDVFIYDEFLQETETIEAKTTKKDRDLSEGTEARS